jgi:hypothetical protein
MWTGADAGVFPPLSALLPVLLLLLLLLIQPHCLC